MTDDFQDSLQDSLASLSTQELELVKKAVKEAWYFLDDLETLIRVKKFSIRDLDRKIDRLIENDPDVPF